MCRTTVWVRAGSPPSLPKTMRIGCPLSPPRRFSDAAQARTPAAAGRVTAPRIPVWAPNDPNTISDPRSLTVPGPAGGAGIDVPAVGPGAGPGSGRSMVLSGRSGVGPGPALSVVRGAAADTAGRAPAAGGASAETVPG